MKPALRMLGFVPVLLTSCSDFPDPAEVKPYLVSDAGLPSDCAISQVRQFAEVTPPSPDYSSIYQVRTTDLCVSRWRAAMRASKHFACSADVIDCQRTETQPEREYREEIARLRFLSAELVQFEVTKI